MPSNCFRRSRPAEMTGSINVESLARTKGLPPSVLRSFGVRDHPGGCVRIAYFSPDGTGARARIRTASGGFAGSHWEPGDLPVTAYWRPPADDWADRIGPILVCEGESSCWTAWHGGFGAVGIPGADMVATLQLSHLGSAEEAVIVIEPEDPQTYPWGRDRYLEAVQDRLRDIRYPGRVRALDLDGVADDVNALYRADKGSFAAQLTDLIAGALIGL